jgi:hypothetical protein
MPSDATARDDARESCSLVSPGDKRALRAYYLLLGGILAVLVVPLWVVDYNTLVDFPSHLGRVHVLANYARVPFFQQLFRLVMEPVPNLASDLFLLPLFAWCSPVTAGKIFLSAIVLLFGLGCHLLAVSIHGRPSWMAPLCALLAYHANFLHGFVNYCFALGLFLIALALWVRFRLHWTVSRCLLLTVLTTAVYLAHFAAFTFLVMGVAWLLLWDWWTRRRVDWRSLLPLLTFAPPALLFVYPWTNKVVFRAPVWPSLTEKVFGAFNLFLGYEFAIDALLLLTLAVTTAFVLWRRCFTVEKSFFWLAIVFLLFYLASPKHTTGYLYSSVDSRFVAPMYLLAGLATIVMLPKSWARLIFSALLFCALLRWGATSWHWHVLSQKTVAMVNVLDKLRPESKIYVLFPMPADRREAKLARATLHTAFYALIRRNSVPGNYFSGRGSGPLFRRHPEQWVDEESPTRFDPQMLTQRLSHFDYLWGCNLDAGSRDFVSSRATLLGEAASCGLWDLHRPKVRLRNDLPLLRIRAGNHLQRRRLTGQQW